MATGVLMGVGVLDEAWPAQPLMSMLRSLAFVFIVGGVCSLNCDNIKQLAGKRVRSGTDLVRLSEVVSTCPRTSSRAKPVVASSATATTAKPIVATSPPKDLSQGAFRNSPKLRGTAAPPVPPAERDAEEEKGHKEYPC